MHPELFDQKTVQLFEWKGKFWIISERDAKAHKLDRRFRWRLRKKGLQILSRLEETV